MVLCDGAGCEVGPGSATEDVTGHAHCLGPHVSLFSLLPISFISRAEIPPFPSPWFPAQNTIQSLCTKPWSISGSPTAGRPRSLQQVFCGSALCVSSMGAARSGRVRLPPTAVGL